jgi:hypothetical protein
MDLTWRQGRDNRKNRFPVAARRLGIAGLSGQSHATTGVRGVVQTNPLNGILANGGSRNITFPGFVTNKFILVYQGTIGVDSGGNAFDPVDSNICIAAARPWIEQTKTYHCQPTLESLGLTNGATITTNLESDDFPFTIAPGGYEMTVNYAAFDDGGTVGGVPATSDVFIACGNPGGMTNTIIPADKISISSNGKASVLALLRLIIQAAVETSGG